ncbi:LacI family transcriptional regulator [Rhodococcus sp. 05-340-1]|uniref:LacI family DNA-binding transcriptional regulator n=1 Tax=unclassified Rhodococcus (in: high G+C Gram-positive bacteria) TaxID=192944 RepID=UPI000B9B5668|nr:MULTISPECIES: LacI family DNA-binding transcriptional regulator [unclassified Rhodococcus (in: high G+C Gram-positive bacteria)]OZD62138.1 LacI family transcriptional regulator [Rhodococcus sp. 05-340-2]OZD78403.1 LacI family transcriptional regulator [Rhodococcus sp. 05-340-1]
MRKATIRDVAERAGVSTATVSRALSGSRPVSEDVAAAIRRAADELGYSGNIIASSLRRNRTDTVGMVVPSIANPFFTSLVVNVEHVLSQRGLQLFLCDSRSDPDVEAQRLRSLVSRQVDGIIISPCHGERSAEAVRTTARAIPVVQLDRFALDTHTDWVGVDDDAAQALVMDHLAALGVRSAAFISSELTNSSTELRRAGFFRHAQRVGIETREEWTLLGDYSIDWGRESSWSMLGASSRPDAVVCADDLIALGVLQSCQALGLSVPADVMVTGFDDIPFSALSNPPLTTVRQPQERIAAEATRLLDQAMNSDETGTAHIALQPELVVRQSTVGQARVTAV